MKRRYWRSTPEAQHTICELYRRRMTADRIAAQVGCSHGTVRRIAALNGIPLRAKNWDKRKILVTDEAKIISAYRAGRDSYDLAREYKITPGAISRFLGRRGVKLRTPREDKRRTWPLNEAAFDTITPESAYWVGFLMADGCVHERFREARRVATISVGLKATDRAHIERFKEFLGSSNSIWERESSSGFSYSLGKKTLTAGIQVSSTRLADALCAFGVVPRKSCVATVKVLENNRHFWRGLIDGDGSVLIVAGGARRWRGMRASLGLVGCAALLAQFREFVSTNVGDVPSPQIDIIGKIGQIKYCGTSAVKVIRYLYAGKVVALRRKLQVARQIIKSFPAVVPLTSHCPKGHPLVKGNLYVYKRGKTTHRHCKKCINDAGAAAHRLRMLTTTPEQRKMRRAAQSMRPS